MLVLGRGLIGVEMAREWGGWLVVVRLCVVDAILGS